MWHSSRTVVSVLSLHCSFFVFERGSVLLFGTEARNSRTFPGLFGGGGSFGGLQVSFKGGYPFGSELGEGSSFSGSGAGMDQLGEKVEISRRGVIFHDKREK